MVLGKLYVPRVAKYFLGKEKIPRGTGGLQ